MFFNNMFFGVAMIFSENSRTREKLNSCTQFRADDKVRKVSILKDDTQILAICTGELTDKEAMYHRSCYRSYTLILYKHENPIAGKKNDTVFDKAYNVVKVVLQDLVRNRNFIEYIKVTERYQEVLVKESFCSHTEIIQYKKNLKGKIEVYFPEINFLSLQNDIQLIYPITLKIYHY